MWRLVIDLPDPTEIDRVAAAFGEECETVSAFEQGAGWRVEGLSRDKPNSALIEAVLALALPDELPPLLVERVPARDWVSENQAGFPPLRAGRFFIHGSHYRGAIPRDAIPILIDAATAFGTGEHATTRGCLLALDRVAHRPRRVLDMGCGTGILSIAAARRWRRPVFASDIDPEAARVTRINAERNHVARLIRAEAAPGYRHRAIARRAPFDLVFANILARPLIEMAPDLARVLAPGGCAILSGLLARHEPAVLSAHRAQGLYLRARIALEGWHTLIVARR
ncbi:MAG TPA: 50S ribosomal protein L11 methyltransferase [Stellaceae bacterium]|jgi:ribosomal protein L11 methyltransferase|nr:50S ribosomal protein L11 methyltransferase [Stellaceae bacterium]